MHQPKSTKIDIVSYLVNHFMSPRSELRPQHLQHLQEKTENMTGFMRFFPCDINKHSPQATNRVLLLPVATLTFRKSA